MKHLVGFIIAALLASPAAAFDRAAWVADFEQLKTAITERSPNLEWAAERGLDLPAVEARARARLDAATDDHAARSALDRFVRNFEDGHMELSWPSAPADASSAPATRSTCRELGYWSEPDDGAVATRLPGYVPLPPGEIEAGTVPFAGRTIGVLRLPLFAPSDRLCGAALAERGLAPAAPCDEACADAVSRRTDALFLAAIETRVRALAGAGVEALLVDVAQNGGGSDTSVAIARMLAGADVPTPAGGLVKSTARAQDLKEDADVLRAGLQGATPAEAALLRPLIAALDAGSADAARPCDLAPLWRAQPPGCSNLIRGLVFAGGLSDRDLPPAMRARPWAETVSSTARFRYTPGLWRGPLLVLVDGNSASSTELFAAMLQDAGRATIIGAPSFGASCGFTLPKQPLTLRHSGGVLEIPDCARFRRNGRNELGGIDPDVLVGFRRTDSPRQRVERLIARLPAALEAAAAQPSAAAVAVSRK